MERDTLFLLKESFHDGGGVPFFCPDCAYINGVLAYFPSLRHRLDVRYVDFQRPRQEIVELIGAENQGCPVLILSKPPSIDAMQLMSGESKDRYYVSGAQAIAQYWSHAFGISRPH